MTGTPIENHLGELWAIMDLVNPGLLGLARGVRAPFARPIETRGDAQALERLRSLCGPSYSGAPRTRPRSTRAPPITIEKVLCTLTVEQASLYRATVDR